MGVITTSELTPTNEIIISFVVEVACKRNHKCKKKMFDVISEGVYLLHLWISLHDSSTTNKITCAVIYLYLRWFFDHYERSIDLYE